MKHVLITRFAVSFAPDNRMRRHSDVPNWLETRFELFNTYCLPSVQAQTFKDFDWVFLVSRDFPKWEQSHTDILSRYGKIVWMTDYFSDAQPGISEALSPLYPEGWLCTTRLDSDDMLANEFMARVHEHATPENKWLSFKNGYFLFDKNKLVGNVTNRNQFLSYIEHADGRVKSVLSKSHRKAELSAGMNKIPYEVFDTQPMHITVCHNNNVGNRTDRNKFTPEFWKNWIPLDKVKSRFTYESC